MNAENPADDREPHRAGGASRVPPDAFPGRPQSGEREVSEQSRGSSCARPILEANEPMTTDENPADTVIEQAARRLAWAMADADGIHPGDFETDPFDDLTDDAQRDVLAFAHALHDAGLLVDPADRDVKARLIAHRNVLRRMNRAEAEVAELEHRLAQTEIALSDAMSAEVAELRAELRVTTNERDRSRVYGRELRATVAAVRSVCQNTDGDWLDGDAEIPVGEVLRMLTLDGTRALDGGGQQ